jgi:NAD+ kinase
MAAGGPILTPTLNAFLITPICPHTISNRPIVLLPEKEITIEYISDHNPIEVTYDGFANHSLSKGETYKISPSSKRFKMVALPHHDFFSTLRTKLGWSGRLKTYG